MKYKCRAYLNTSHFMQPVEADSYDAAVDLAAAAFDKEFGEGSADELVLYFQLVEADEEPGK